MQLRQQTILDLIVNEYIKTAEPVGSQILVKKYKLDVSSATVRNEMAELESTGYLEQPHTSAGRVPTDKGYRFFVDVLMESGVCEEIEDFNNFVDVLKQQPLEHRRLIKELARAISDISHNVGICGFLEDDVFFSAGLSNLLREPEFSSNPEAIDSFGFFDYLDKEIKEFFEEMDKDMQVFIGKESRDKKFDDFSLVVSRCENKKGKEGVVGVLGPKRMDYARNIKLVDIAKDMVKNF
jgi:heat-inducible transcriptional repressor